MLMLRSVFSTFDIDLGVFHSVHTPSKLSPQNVRTECVLSASCVRTCVFRRIVVNVFLLT